MYEIFENNSLSLLNFQDFRNKWVGVGVSMYLKGADNANRAMLQCYLVVKIVQVILSVSSQWALEILSCQGVRGLVI